MIRTTQHNTTQRMRCDSRPVKIKRTENIILLCSAANLNIIMDLFFHRFVTVLQFLRDLKLFHNYIIFSLFDLKTKKFCSINSVMIYFPVSFVTGNYWWIHRRQKKKTIDSNEWKSKLIKLFEKNCLPISNCRERLRL